ncbi:MAG: ABC transporter permease, partial [Paramuribaculum sp.]|nr:ABC transporter permease [Paramuribaculum sp.]
MLDLFREIGQTLSNNKLRTVLTGIAVAWGILMLIILVSISRGVYNSFESNTAGSSAQATINIYSGTTTKAFDGFKEGRFVRLHTRDIPHIVDSNPEMVSAVHTTISVDSAKVENIHDYTT